VAVIGIQDEKYGEDIMAFVVKKPGAKVTENDIIFHCHENSTKFKSPSHITFIESLPKSLVGKILKKELRKMVT